ncbi:NAD-dependent epimerase/dehydratase family protein [Thermococcus waiotapuensis]|uniref:Sugar nucleotide-binding protein n=1 Tax=Thermococcus waiotapuensis TaxID=90909 RepID=A0AAE4NVA1_9EURY|nr:NAD-dependent epimerase/dehydratase family protein [Thermococcus waiotapuensis]MDV3103902.1 sugar nucleotide-binding protein [Thermococcus waiotapuensis]
MKVLLLGGSGFIGGYVLGELLQREHEVVVPTRRDLKYDIRTIKVSGLPEDYARLVEELDPDVVINLVGVLKGDYSVHYEIPRALSDAIKGTDIRLVHMSALGADENSPIEYFRSKALGEREVRKLGDYAIVRPSLVLGPGQRLFKEVLRWRVFPKLKTPVQPVDVRDLAKLLADLAEKNGRDELNVCGAKVIPLGQLVRLVVNKAGKRIFLIPLPESLLKAAGKLDNSLLMALTPNVCPEKGVVFGRPLEESIAFAAEGLRWATTR